MVDEYDSYNFFCSESPTPDMADEYDWELPELNEEQICLQDIYLQKPADIEMTDTHDNAYDPAIIEPTKEVVYDYSTGVVSEEDEMTVETTANISTPSEFSLSRGNSHHFKFKTPLIYCFQSQQLLIWWMNMTVNCLNSMKRGYVTVLHSQQILK